MLHFTLQHHLRQRTQCSAVQLQQRALEAQANFAWLQSWSFINSATGLPFLDQIKPVLVFWGSQAPVIWALLIVTNIFCKYRQSGTCFRDDVNPVKRFKHICVLRAWKAHHSRRLRVYHPGKVEQKREGLFLFFFFRLLWKLISRNLCFKIMSL